MSDERREPKIYRILVVDDDLPSRELIQATLEVSGINAQVQMESTVYGMEKILFDQKQRFDLITLDPDLFGRSPVDLLRKLRNEGVNTPVILNAADSSLGTWERYRGLGVAAYISKPTDAIELQQNIMKILRRETAHR